MQTKKKLINQERARSAAYTRLADAFRQPGPDLPKALDELEAALGRIGSDAVETAAGFKRYYFDQSAPCSLEVDYAGLFVGPFIVAAPPYGSVYLEDKRQLMGDSTIDVRRHYLDLGLDLSPDFKEAPDHICAELEFMHVLISQGAEAIDAGDYDQVVESIRHQRVFLEKHLASWIPAFTAKLIDHARTDYYRRLGELTRQFIAEEMDAISDLDVPQLEVAAVQ
ncbi:MAG: molecular chaperone TorD family protein [Desulfosarcina sp.]